MGFLSPAYLLLGLLAAPIIALYLLRLRRPEQPISSTFLWQLLLRDQAVNTPWQKLRRNVLLLLQLLLLAALVLALARPFWPTATVASGNVVVLLDASASMQATDALPNRFEAARQAAARLIARLSGGDQMTLIQVGLTPQVLAAATADRDLLRRALAGAQVSQGSADWTAAYALAAGAAQGFSQAQVVVISDGGLPAGLPPLPVETVYWPVGRHADNLGLAALAANQQGGEAQLLAGVVNYGPQTRTALVSLSVDGALLDARRVTAAAGERVNLIWSLPPGARLATAQLSQQGTDYLALDDRAWAVVGAGAPRRAVLVTAGNRFVEQVFSLLPDMTLLKVDSAESLPPGADLTIIDSLPVPATVPPGALFLINPQGDNSLLSVSGVFTQTTTTRLASSPLLNFVDWSGVHVRQAQAVTAPWAQTLVGAAAGPLLAVGETQGRRVALLTFDVRDSDLPLQIAFPVLIANLTAWLTPGRVLTGGTAFQPGQAVSITPGAAEAVRIIGPDGVARQLPATGGALLFGETGQLGLYQVSLRDADGDQPAGAFAVNLFAPQESALAPAAAIPGGGDQADESTAQAGRLELWPWPVGLGLGLLLVEWWVYQRGRRLPA